VTHTDLFDALDHQVRDKHKSLHNYSLYTLSTHYTLHTQYSHSTLSTHYTLSTLSLHTLYTLCTDCKLRERERARARESFSWELSITEDMGRRANAYGL
jgi:hypothetical protein